MTEQLVTSAGHNPVLDSFRSGTIAAFKDVINYNFDLDESGEEH